MSDEPSTIDEMNVHGGRLKKRRTPVSNIKLASLMTKHHGNIWRMCEEEDLNYRSTKRRINADPELLALMAEQREVIVDLAEHHTIANMKAGNQAAASLILNVWGRDRGYGKQIVEHVGKDGGPIQQEQNVTAAVSDVAAPLSVADFEAARRKFVTGGK